MVEPIGRLAPPCVLVIFGAAGDLTKRLLLPTVVNLVEHGLVGRRLVIVGVTRQPWGHDDFREQMAAAVRTYNVGTFDAAVVESLLPRLYHVCGDINDPATYTGLRTLLAEVDAEWETEGNYIYYLAVPPGLFEVIVDRLGQAELAKAAPGAAGWRRVIVEKPFGHDLDSAQALVTRMSQVFDEEQIYRIDHYLGKETVQNILVFRLGNGIFEPVWNRRYIDNVQITVSESLGVEGRGGYYETAGALRDMLQNHLFQLLTLIAMEPPAAFDPASVRNEKVKVLKAVRPMTPEQVLQQTVRGQYGAGTIDGAVVPGYQQEPGVASNSWTETYAALELSIDNWRWAGVPFYLRSGKRLTKRDTQIVITFRRAPLRLFADTAVHDLESNVLVIHVQPDEKITLRIQAKRPGTTVTVVPVQMEFQYETLGEASPSTGYETLLYDCMNGDSTLYNRADMVEASWSVVTPILDVWEALPPRDFPNYTAGSWGPAAADTLLQRSNRAWHRVE